MLNQKRIRDYAITIGELTPGEKNAITDIKGITVGHCTLDKGAVQTGVTAILPHQGNLFQDKILSACHIINGFGKSTGLIQIEELGTIETPILLTNTLCVGRVSDALIDHMLETNADIGIKTGTVNPVVCECNDGYLNDIRDRQISKDHVLKAIRTASTDFEEGSVGAGRGMSCYKLKGGIGTASRRLSLNGHEGHLGCLVLSNMGQKKDFILNGNPIGKTINEIDQQDIAPDLGSIIVILATDFPMTERQLKRIAKRAVVGINRTGSFIGNGSGEVVLSFSTKNRVSHYKNHDIEKIERVDENHMDLFFQAAAETTEEAILNSMITAKPVTGRDNLSRSTLSKFKNIF